MDINRLRIFLDLAHTLNYSKTAERLYTTQGNISKQIQSLESELQLQLFNRDHRSITLSEDGDMIQPYARKMLDDYEKMMLAVKDSAEKSKRNLRICTIPTMSGYEGFLVLSKFMHENSTITVELKEAESIQLMDLLRRNDCDVIFARTEISKEPDLEQIVTDKDQFVVVVSSKNPLSMKKELSFADLRNEKFLQLNEETQLYEPFLQMAQAAKIEPNVVYSGVRADLIIGMVERNLGISIMMEKTAQSFNNKDISIIKLSNTQKNDLGFIKKKSHDERATKAFWSFVQKEIKQ